MACLTLARYINETALMSYKIVTQKESLIAAGCLRLAMLMSHPDHSWVSVIILVMCCVLLRDAFMIGPHGGT